MWGGLNSAHEDILCARGGQTLTSDIVFTHSQLNLLKWRLLLNLEYMNLACQFVPAAPVSPFKYVVYRWATMVGQHFCGHWRSELMSSTLSTKPYL